MITLISVIHQYFYMVLLQIYIPTDDLHSNVQQCTQSNLCSSVSDRATEACLVLLSLLFINQYGIRYSSLSFHIIINIASCAKVDLL